MSEDLTTHKAVLSAIFVFRTNKAVKVKLSEDAEENLWIPMSQIYSISQEDGGDTDYLNLDPNTGYLWDISPWIALKLFDADGWEDLVDLELSFLDLD
jgi:hypothetical protein